jgi:hypothetical protein
MKYFRFVKGGYVGECAGSGDTVNLIRAAHPDLNAFFVEIHSLE